MEQDVIDSCRQQLKKHIEMLLGLGMGKAHIEIELHVYIKDLLKEE